MRKRLLYGSASVLLALCVVVVALAGIHPRDIRQSRADIHPLGDLHSQLYPDGHARLDSVSHARQALYRAEEQSRRIANSHQAGPWGPDADQRSRGVSGVVELYGIQLQHTGLVPGADSKSSGHLFGSGQDSGTGDAGRNGFPGGAAGRATRDFAVCYSNAS